MDKLTKYLDFFTSSHRVQKNSPALQLMSTINTTASRSCCWQSDVLFTNQSASGVLAKLARIKLKFINFHHNVVGPEWSTHGLAELDYRHHIHFFCGGSAHLIHQGASLELRPGYVYWVPSNVSVARHCDHPFEEFILTCHCELIDGIDLFVDWPEHQPLCVGRWDMETLHHEWTQKPLSLNTYMRLQGQLFQRMADYFGDLDKIVLHHSLMFTRYARVFDLSEARLGADLRIADLAEAHGTSLQAFSTAFSRDLGISPKAYLNRRLNQEACQLVINTDWTLKMIAVRLRFSDEYYFSRFFSKMNGISPRKYRQMFFL